MREEIEACGGDFDRRGSIADEAIDLMRTLWRGTEPNGTSFHGATYSIDHAHSWPKPVRADGRRCTWAGAARPRRGGPAGSARAASGC
jgi:alkanesulfonate monooxygenase SsuD/methylene tetrahydromethanopterin reductase-like flavin-dependent oxidoreductase (luciferase family)